MYTLYLLDRFEMHTQSLCINVLENTNLHEYSHPFHFIQHVLLMTNNEEFLWKISIDHIDVVKYIKMKQIFIWW